MVIYLFLIILSFLLLYLYMYSKSKNLTEGQTYVCNAGDPQNCPKEACAYMGMGNQLRYIATGNIGRSWNPNWNLNVQSIDCNGIIRGPDLTKKVV